VVGCGRGVGIKFT